MLTSNTDYQTAGELEYSDSQANYSKQFAKPKRKYCRCCSLPCFICTWILVAVLITLGAMGGYVYHVASHAQAPKITSYTTTYDVQKGQKNTIFGPVMTFEGATGNTPLNIDNGNKVAVTLDPKVLPVYWDTQFTEIGTVTVPGITVESGDNGNITLVTLINNADAEAINIAQALFTTGTTRFRTEGQLLAHAKVIARVTIPINLVCWVTVTDDGQGNFNADTNCDVQRGDIRLGD